ncbi:MAG: proton-conducting transporter membrane subunit [Elusimicrobiota bacterium]|jgi:NADH-quinone oxidoreductase subunit N
MGAPLALIAGPLSACAGLVLVLLLGLRKDHPAPHNPFIERCAAMACTAIGLFFLLNAPEAARTELLRADGWSRCWQALFHLATLGLLATIPLKGERPLILALASLAGLDFLASADNLLMLFVSLELMSLPVYLLVWGLLPSRKSLEAGIKYFLTGAAASALFLFGLALQYSASGSFSLHGERSADSALGFALMCAAALFKTGIVPFQFWLPDVYEASEPELAGWMSTALKAAGLLLLARLLFASPAVPAALWLSPLAALSMLLGNILALRQQNLRRLLAYSSIAHAGALAAALCAWTREPHAAPAVIFSYLSAYLFMNFGGFLGLRLTGALCVQDLSGLGRRAPLRSAFLALMLLSLAGLPPTLGFLAKLYVFLDLLQAGDKFLAAALALSSLIGLGYYLGLVRRMYMDEPAAAAEQPPICSRMAHSLIAVLCALACMLGGLYPSMSTDIGSVLAAPAAEGSVR